MTINPTTRISDIALHVPSSVRVFERHGVDFCCGGKRPIAEVCEERGLSFDAVVQEIELASAAPHEDRDWSTAPLAELTTHIVTVYHEPLRAELPRLGALVARVMKAHAAKAPDLLQEVESIVGDLSADLVVHMRKEEDILFPAIRRLEAAGASGFSFDMPVRMLEIEHDRAGELLGQLRRVTADFVPPDWACATVRALYDGFAELESAMHVHVHLENNVLFPRTLALAAEAAAGRRAPAATAVASRGSEN